ncbi:proteasome maturation factor UMP1 [Schizophyllum amplum]|uniref:Proteasome maturation factor UMP1 n=1 Tax=Schizophyllum amplum TaxID=97359 RepID=A0A550CDK9_9AGAR|nr:proteasome maturation factor UMP1 [Auriculariopsis ampla]
MDPSLRIVPAAAPKSANLKDTANSLGLHNTLQYGPRTLATEINKGDGFQHRLENWAETQDNLKLSMQRNVYGLHAPMRLLMERKIVSHGMQGMPAMPAQSNLQLDILMGRDESIEPSDIFFNAERAPPLSAHEEMEKKRGL